MQRSVAKSDMVFPHYTLLCICLCIWNCWQTNIWPEHFLLLRTKKQVHCIFKGILLKFHPPLPYPPQAGLCFHTGHLLLHLFAQLRRSQITSYSTVWLSALQHTDPPLWTIRMTFRSALRLSMLNMHSTTDDKGRQLVMKQARKHAF